jgi:type I restriction enzyme M protein
VRAQNTILFIDARGFYRQVNRAIRDFLPEQIEFLANIVRLYRGRPVETEAGSGEMLAAHFLPSSSGNGAYTCRFFKKTVTRHRVAVN